MKTSNALVNASQALAITSQLLAIGIELGLIAGGFYIYKKFIKPEPEKAEPDAVLIPDGMQLVTVKNSKPTLKDKFEKAKKIVMAVVS